MDEIGVAPDGSPCFFSRAVPVGDSGLSPGSNLGNVSGPQMANYGRCPASPNSPAAPAIDPRTVAVEGWEEVSLPAPEPYIAPGWAITGKYAYLETRGQLHHTFTKETPIGSLRIDSSASYYVDWGDGETSGPHSSEGGPWPDGQITHTYIDVGTYDVTVTARWRATWSLGPNSGTLTGQQTSGVIDDLRVERGCPTRRGTSVAAPMTSTRPPPSLDCTWSL